MTDHALASFEAKDGTGRWEVFTWGIIANGQRYHFTKQSHIVCAGLPGRTEKHVYQTEEDDGFGLWAALAVYQETGSLADAGLAAWALGGGTGGTSGKLAGLGVELGVLLGRHDLDGTGPGLGGTAKTAPSVEVHFALSIVHCFLVSPTYSGRFPEDQGLEAHCPPWSDGPAAGELGAVSDRGWGERRAYYDHGRAAAPGQGRGGAVSAAGLRRPDHPKPAVPAGA